MSAIVGVDYAFDPHPSPLAIRNYGAWFVARYISDIQANDANGKNLTKAELDELGASSISVVLVFETAANRMLSGQGAGAADAEFAKQKAAELGMGSTPVYFACDFDAAPGQQAEIDSYLDGCVSVLGVDRVGIYGGFYPVSRALDAGKAKWAFQTYAWSAGQWDHRSQIRQTGTAVIDGAHCDADFAEYPNYGQWPPYAPPKPPEPPVSTFAVTLPTVTEGQKSGLVKTVQALAGAKRGKTLAIDGDFGPATEQLVKEAQASSGLAQDGVVGELTWKALLGL